jgi:hypothetical protein
VGNTEVYSWDTPFGHDNPRLGTHVGKLYSASTLVLSLSASCSWDGGSQASNSTQTECSPNVPECLCISALWDSHAEVASSLPPRRSAGRAFALVHCGILMQTLLVRCLRDVLREEPLH